MDFIDSPDEAAFRAEARAWLAENAPRYEVPDPTRVGDIESAEDLERAKAWQALKADAGWACVHWPEQFGGRGLPGIFSILFSSEETHYAVPRGAFFNIGLAFCGPTLMAYGTPDQQQKMLPKLLRGEEIWCQLFSEPGAGSDLAGLRTRAERDGDEWVVNGQKIWTTYAHIADWGILVTRHDPDVAKHKGLTYFFVDMKSPGVEPRPIRQIAGSSHFNEVFFTNARIPDEHRLGAVGEGWQVAITTLMNERLGATSADAAPSFRHAYELARETWLEDRPAIAHSDVRERLAEWYVASRGLELIHSRTLTRLSKGQQPGPESSIRKLVAAHLQQHISSFGLDLQEAGGMIEDESATAQGGLFFKTYLQSPGSRIAGGSDEILRNILAERVLGLPGDIRVDRDKPFREIPVGRA